MANPSECLNQNFLFDYLLAKGLVQLLPSKDRSTVLSWLAKLNEVDQNPGEMTVRNDYMSYLLLMLHSKKITVPFNEPPLKGVLRPLIEILPADIYNKIVLQNNSSKLQFPMNNDADPVQRQQPTVSVSPCKFLKSQPRPRDGVICYMAAFSTQDF